MQSAIKSADPARALQKKTILNTLSYIYSENGLKGLYRGVTPRIALGERFRKGTVQRCLEADRLIGLRGSGIWQTVCMVTFADYVKAL